MFGEKVTSASNASSKPATNSTTPGSDRSSVSAKSGILSGVEFSQNSGKTKVVNGKDTVSTAGSPGSLSVEQSNYAYYASIWSKVRKTLRSLLVDYEVVQVDTNNAVKGRYERSSASNLIFACLFSYNTDHFHD